MPGDILTQEILVITCRVWLRWHQCVVQTAPGITPALVERLVASRQDLTKADIREVGAAMHSTSSHVSCAVPPHAVAAQLIPPCKENPIR